MRLGGVLERIFVTGRNLHGTRANLLEQILGSRHQVFALGGIVVERRAGGEQRALGL